MSQVSSLRSQISRIALWGCSLNAMANVIVIVHFQILKLSKHCKNYECCPVSLFIVRSLKDCHDWGTQLSEMSSVSQGFTIHKSVQECFPSVLVIGHGHSHDPSLGLLFDNLRSPFWKLGVWDAYPHLNGWIKASLLPIDVNWWFQIVDKTVLK